MTRWERTWWVWVRVGVPRRHRPRKEKNLRRALHSSFDRPDASRWSAKRTCCSCALYSARFALISAKVCGDSSSDMARGEPCAARDEKEARCVVPRKRRRKVLLAEKSEAKHVKLRPSCRLTRERMSQRVAVAMFASTSTACVCVPGPVRGGHAVPRRVAGASPVIASVLGFGRARALPHGASLGHARGASRRDFVVTASSREDEAGAPGKPARRVRKLPKRDPPPGGRADETKAPTAATADDDAEEADADADDEDAPVVFDMKELYGESFESSASVDEKEEDGVFDDEGSDGSVDEDDTWDGPLVPPVQVSLLEKDCEGHKCGYVAIVGRPNAGKSTLMNTLVGQKLSVVTHKPQTTRHKILGIVSEHEYQMVLLDTPGVMREEFNKLDEMMLISVRNAIANADVMLVIVDASRDPIGNFEGLLPENLNLTDRAPVGVILNKCDLLNVDEIKQVRTSRFPHPDTLFAQTGLTLFVRDSS